MKSRKNVIALLENIEWLKKRHENFEKNFVEIAGRDAYEKTAEYYNEAILKLKKEIQSLPIGYRYTQTCYVKEPYTEPAEYRKIDTSIFMREDLVSWQVENHETIEYYTYFRSVYKEPRFDAEIIRREDAKPVYEKESEEVAV